MRKGKENQIIQFLLDNGKIRGALLDSTSLVQDAADFHGYGPVETLIAGQAISAAALLTVTIKGNDRQRLSVECGGPIGGWSADLNAHGDVRGYLENNPIVMEADKAVTMDNLYGPGFFHMMKSAEGAKTPFTGSVELLYPDLANNLAYYFMHSDQTPTAFILSVDISREGTLAGSAALFLQALPGADENQLEKLQETLKDTGSLYREILEAGDPGEWLLDRLSDFSPSVIGLKNVRFHCPCSRDQIGTFLKGMGREKSDSLLEKEDGGLMIRCHGCSEEYHFTGGEIEKLFTEES